MRPKLNLKPINLLAVRMALVRHDMYFNDLARAVGITAGHMSHVMNGKRPSPAVRKRMCEVLELTMDELTAPYEKKESSNAQSHAISS